MSLGLGSFELKGTDPERYFERYGGLALGLLILDQLADEFVEILCPRHAVIPLDSLAAEAEGSASWAKLDSMRGLKVMCRLAGVQEAFSRWSVRGADSAGFRGREVFSNPCFVVGDDFSMAELRSWVARAASPSSRAVVIQELVASPDRRSFIVHADSREVVTEIRWNGVTYLFVSTKPGCIDHRESTRPDRSTSDLEQSLDAHRLFDLAWRTADRLGFPVNTEGHYHDGKFMLRQLRPIPPDNRPDLSIRETMRRVDTAGFSEVRTTHFVWGRFDIESIVRSEDVPVAIARAAEPLIVAIDSVQRLSPTARRQLCSLNEYEHAMTPELVLKAKHSIMTPRPWDIPVVRDRLAADRTTVVIYFDRGFKLSHKPEFLPPPGFLRDRYCCVSLIGHSVETLLSRRARLLSDGSTALVCLA